MSKIENTKINDYINDVCKHIKNKKIHKLIKEELLCHIHEIIDDCISRGMTEDTAIDYALLQMGNSNVVGNDLNKVHKTNSDWILIAMTSALVFFGMFTLSFIQNNISLDLPNIFMKTAVYLIISIALSLAFIKLDFRVIKKYSYYIYGVSILLLILGLFFSPIIYGAKGWLVISIFSINVLTVSTLLLIISLAGIFDNYNWSNTKNILKSISLVILPTILFAFVPSIQTSVIYLIAAFTIMLISGFNIKHLILLSGTLSGIFLASILNSEYRMERFFIFLNPSTDAEGAGWLYNKLSTLRQSSSALGQGSNFDLSQIPEAHTDFVLTSIIYSFGWIAAILLIVLVLAFIIRIGFIGAKSKNNYGKLLVSGLCSLFTIEFVLSILANFSLSPFLSVSMPFISYGGSQLLINIIAISIINNVYKFRNTHYNIAS